MTAQELGLPPRFERAMKRRLGATRIFVEVNGKYYLDEARLQQPERQRDGAEGQRQNRQHILALRMVRMVVGITAVILVLTNIFILKSKYVGLVIIALIVLWVVLTVFQLYYLSRVRRRLRGAS